LYVIGVIIDDNPNPFDMKVSVFYTKRNYSPFDYSFDQTIMKRNYDENGEFIDREYVTPSLEMYEKVGEHEFFSQPNEDIFEKIVTSYNIGNRPSEITEKIRSGELNVGFSSFSVGCVIKIEGCYYISNGYTFDLLPLEFSNSQ